MNKSYNQIKGGSIRSWRVEERPREKMCSNGPEQLSLAELLAVILRSGNQNESAVDLAQRILLAADQDLHQIARWSVADFCRFKGVGEAKAVALVAALELGRRRASQSARQQARFNDSAASYAYLRPLIGDLQHEEFWVLLLNQGHALLGAQLISRGGVTGTVADARIIFRKALETSSCTSIILAHNHPSGQVFPSAADRLLTQKLSKAARLLDLLILDHLIVTQHGYFSFADAEELQPTSATN